MVRGAITALVPLCNTAVVELFWRGEGVKGAAQPVAYRARYRLVSTLLVPLMLPDLAAATALRTGMHASWD